MSFLLSPDKNITLTILFSFNYLQSSLSAACHYHLSILIFPVEAELLPSFLDPHFLPFDPLIGF